MPGIFSTPSSKKGALPKGYSNPRVWGALPKASIPTQKTGPRYLKTGGQRRLSLGNINRENYHMLAQYGAGGIGTDFPQGDVGNPFWFSNIGGNHFPREGFTYQPYDSPIVPFSQQLQGFIDDEDARMSINFLASKITGGEHYFQGKTESIISHFKDWTKKINLDYMSWHIAKECLAFGNSFWRPRKPLWECQSIEDFQHLPISSLARVWWTPDRRPIWYEFRGADYNGYFRPYEILHFKWDPVNASVLGFGIMVQLVKTVNYFEQTPDGEVEITRMSYLDIKHGIQNLVYRSLYRYVPRNVYEAPESTEEERDLIREDLRILYPGEDLVHGSRGLKVQELGQGTKAYEPNSFMDLFQGSIFKAVQTSKGRIAGQSQGPTYANGEQSSELDEIGLSFFAVDLKNQIMEKLLRPWYFYHEIKDPQLAGGIVNIPYEYTDIDLVFGKQKKTDIEPDVLMQWIQVLQSVNGISPMEVRKAAEQAGVPLSSDEEGNLPGLTNTDAQMPGQAPGQDTNQMQPGQNVKPNDVKQMMYNPMNSKDVKEAILKLKARK